MSSRDELRSLLGDKDDLLPLGERLRSLRGVLLRDDLRRLRGDRSQDRSSQGELEPCMRLSLDEDLLSLRLSKLRSLGELVLRSLRPCLLGDGLRSRRIRGGDNGPCSQRPPLCRGLSSRSRFFPRRTGLLSRFLTDGGLGGRGVEGLLGPFLGISLLVGLKGGISDSTPGGPNAGFGLDFDCPTTNLSNSSFSLLEPLDLSDDWVPSLGSFLGIKRLSYSSLLEESAGFGTNLGSVLPGT